MNKLQQIQTALKAPKGQTNAFGKYKYRSCEDIMEAVKPLLSEHGLSLIVSDQIIEVGGRVYVEATAELCDENKVTAMSKASAREPEAKKGMDEAQITGATSSYARKYALNGLFAIDDTKDADATNDHKPTPKITSKDACVKLDTAKTIDKLVSIWNALPVDIKQVDEVIAKKDELKTEFTTK
jgi:hypothetical protein